MIQTILTMYIIHIAGMVLYVGKEFYVIQILELFYVEIIIFPVIFGGQTPPGKFFTFLNVAVRLFSVVKPLQVCHGNKSD